MAISTGVEDVVTERGKSTVVSRVHGTNKHRILGLDRIPAMLLSSCE